MPKKTENKKTVNKKKTGKTLGGGGAKGATKPQKPTKKK